MKLNRLNFYDKDFYLTEYPQLKKSIRTIRQVKKHWMNIGKHKGYYCNSFLKQYSDFNWLNYINNNNITITNEVDAFIHWVNYGKRNRDLYAIRDLVTIIIYRSEEYLEKILLSLKKYQKHMNIIILSNSRDVVNKEDDINYIFLKETLSALLQHGIQYSRKYNPTCILLLNGDKVLSENWIPLGKSLLNKFDVIGKDNYYMPNHYGNIINIKFKNKMSFVAPELIGKYLVRSGLMIHVRILRKLCWNLYGNREINSGIDLLATEILAKNNARFYNVQDDNMEIMSLVYYNNAITSLRRNKNLHIMDVININNNYLMTYFKFKKLPLNINKKVVAEIFKKPHIVKPSDIKSDLTLNTIASNTSVPNTYDKYFNNIGIHQVRVSSTLSFFRPKIERAYNLGKYTAIEKSAVFFGCYTLGDLDSITKHRVKSYLIWGGTDANIHINRNRTEKIISEIKKNRNVIHLAISDDLYDRLGKLGIVSKKILFNLSLHDPQFRARETLGNYIYIYNGLTKGSENKYGEEHYLKIMKKLPKFHFVLSNHINVDANHVGNIYEKCFVGIRLTENDGNANTVQEMGLVGIPVIHNGENPNSIQWSAGKIDHIVDLIQKLYVNKNTNISDSVRRYLAGKKVYDISVLMNTYQESKDNLIRSINNVFKQRNVDIELIISTVEDDPSIEIIKKYYPKSKQIKLCISSKAEHPGRGPNGIYYQINKALNLVTKRWFTYISSNDAFNNDKFYREISMCVMFRKKVCYSNFYKCKNTIANKKVYYKSAPHLTNYNYNKHKNGNYVNDCAVIETELLNKLKPFNYPLYGNTAYWDFWLRVYENYGDQFIYLHTPTWYYIVTNASQHLNRSRAETNIYRNKIKHIKERPTSHKMAILYKPTINYDLMKKNLFELKQRLPSIQIYMLAKNKTDIIFALANEIYYIYDEACSIPQGLNELKQYNIDVLMILDKCYFFGNDYIKDLYKLCGKSGTIVGNDKYKIHDKKKFISKINDTVIAKLIPKAILTKYDWNYERIATNYTKYKTNVPNLPVFMCEKVYNLL
jgi:hypothetical protein